MDIEKRKEYIEKLEGLVHYRFSPNALADELSKILNKEIDKVQDTTLEDSDDDLEYDYCITCGNDDVLVDIYYLPMRNGNYYITEVGYDFDGLI